MADAVLDGTISKRSLVFAPAFGAVGGYVILSLDSTMVAPEVITALAMSPSPAKAHSSMEDIKDAFYA